MTTLKYLPIDVSKADQVFGDKAMQILPPYTAIPDEFKSQCGQWVKWQSDWFYNGLNQLPEPKDGIDVKKAMSNLACIQGSFEPKHEHKSAGVAYLASLWFSSPNGKPISKAKATS